MGDASAALGHPCGLSLIGRLGRLVAQAYLLILLGRHDLVCHQSLGTLILRLGRLVGQLGLHQRVAILEPLGRDARKGLALAERLSLDERGLRIVEHARRCGHHHRLVTDGRLQVSGRLDDIVEGHLGYLLHHEPSRLGLLLREGDTLAMIMAVGLVSVSVVRMGIMLVRRMVMVFVRMSVSVVAVLLI